MLISERLFAIPRTEWNRRWSLCFKVVYSTRCNVKRAGI